MATGPPPPRDEEFLINPSAKSLGGLWVRQASLVDLVN
jgi:hypothetical protein